MREERLLQINLATMAALGTLLLGMGQRSVGLPVMTLAAAGLSVWLTDVTGWVRLNRPLASVAAVAAVGLAIRDLFPLERAVFILAVADLLVYLQLVLLFQPKDARIYWQLCVVSVLQVVVAAAFSQGVLFGALLVAYLLVGLSALALWYLVREGWRHAGSSADTLIGEGVGRDLLGRLGMVGLGTMLLTAVVFFCVPRWGWSAWPGALTATRHLVGYSGEVRLGELGEVMENPTDILRIEFHNPGSDAPLRVHSDVYLHGTVLMRYADGQWSRGSPHSRRPPRIPHRWGAWRRGERWGAWPPAREALPSATPPAAEGLITQKIIIEPLDQQEIFYVRPAIAGIERDDIQIDPRTECLARPLAAVRSRFVFSLYTAPFARGEQAGWVPYRPVPVDADLTPWSSGLAELDADLLQTAARMEDADLEAELLQMPDAAEAHGLPRLAALARRWMAESGVPADDLVRRARYLAHRLRDSGQFAYSLEGEPRDPSIDPIEDFIAEHPRGHCEYFATALAMMLRSQGIPCRLVVGYRCDEWNTLGGFYQVRQSHAHAWVEALIPRDEFPAEVDRDHWIWAKARAGWLRLDATPAGRAESAAQPNAILALLVGLFDWLEEFWENYVMEMDRARQYKAIYGPVGRWARDLARQLDDPDWWRRLFSRAANGLDARRWNVQQWLSWRGGLLGALVYLAVVLTYWAARGSVRWWLARFGSPSTAGGRGQGPEVAFYRRLQSLLSGYGLVRPRGRTPREFALDAGKHIVTRTGDPRLLPLPVQLTDAFYQIRFGHRPLDNRQSEAVEQALAELEHAAERRGR